MALVSVYELKRWVSKSRFQTGQVFVRLVLKLYFLILRSVSSLVCAYPPGPQRHFIACINEIYIIFSYPFYYTISTGMLISNLGGSWRKNFKTTLVCLFAQQPATCGLSLSIESGCGCLSTLQNSCISLLSASLYGRLYKIETKSTNHCQSTTRYSDQLLAILSQPLLSETRSKIKDAIQIFFFQYRHSLFFFPF